jgi:hypothetical protein
MTSTSHKAIRRQVRHLRADWRRWRHAKPDDPMRIDFDLICPVTRNAYRNGEPVLCGDLTCEGCAATLYRADRMAEITAEAKRLVVDASDLSCQALALLDPKALAFHGQPVEGYQAEMTRRGEDHVQSCDLTGHLSTP